MLHGKSDELLADGSLARLERKINLIFTSPPFPLNRKKRYGNETGEAYIKWLCAFGPLFTNPTNKPVTLNPGDRAILAAETREFRSPSRSQIPI